MIAQPPVSIRTRINQLFVVLVIVCVASVAVGGYLTFDAHIEAPETVTEEQTTGTWTVEGEFEHAATVNRDSDPFSAGDRLTNRPLYFTSVTPVLDVTYVLTHEATGDKPASATTDFSLVISAVQEANGETVTHWKISEPLENVEGVTVDTGRTSVATVQVNVQAVQNRIEAVQSNLGSTPGDTRVELVADTAITGQLDDNSIDTTRTDRLQLEPQASVYTVSAAVQSPITRETTTSVARTVRPSPIFLYGGPIILLAGFSGLLILLVGRSSGWLDVTGTERAHYRFTIARSDLDGWISTADIPPAGSRQIARTATLTDLVDIAINSDQPVIENNGEYATIVDNVMYLYVAPETSANTTKKHVDGADGSGDTTASDTGANNDT
ncbi:DUF5305 family protein [Halorubrum sp. ARQ200]|uniref:DUF5305 family protein n=1 Tax=Halorubrum sp. ARQ200 TaxID=1855872 RepID=UPI0010F55CB4|nr:DUF5305 family protein [Halorubrum sp. ARQ200]TKX43671.1 hypothetical protein EXE50_09385 [Halorubrum sp. ARQ200]